MIAVRGNIPGDLVWELVFLFRATLCFYVATIGAPGRLRGSLKVEGRPNYIEEKLDRGAQMSRDHNCAILKKKSV